MRAMSPAALQAMLAQQTDEVFLVCLTITHSSFPAPIRAVNNTTPITRAAGTFQPYAFDITLPPEEEDKMPQVSLAIDAVDLEVIRHLRAIRGGRPNVRIEVVLASSPDTVEAGPFDFALLDAEYDALQVRGRLGLEEDLLSTSFPAGVYTPSNSPGLFA